MSVYRVIGTAGHIDHGKTSLVKALTGIDTDRLKEEKERGITIELGFAHLSLPSGQVVSVIDVPGHERFVRTMVAGAVGIDSVVLVVAADEGVMPQTREHLDICSLLGIRSGVVALTKCDLVTPDLLDLAKEELREILSGTFLSHSEIIPCSVRTGVGLRELPLAIERALRSAPARDQEAIPRLPIDRVFTLKGFGTVVTATLMAGKLHVGDELTPVPPHRAALTAKVRGLHVHGHTVKASYAGQRTAANLSIPLSSIHKGETLAPVGTLAASSVMDVSLTHLPVARAVLPRRSRLLIHVGTAQRLANVLLLDRTELEPGQTALAQITLSEPLCVMPGDRFVLRGFAPQKHHGTTIGGGVILRNLSTPQRRKNPALCDTLQAVSDQLKKLSVPSERAAAILSLTQLHIERKAIKGSCIPDLLRALPIGITALQRALEALLVTSAIVRQTDIAETEEGAWLSQSSYLQIRQGIFDAVATALAQDPSLPGLPKEQLRTQPKGPLCGLSARLFESVCLRMISDGVLVAEKERLQIPSGRAVPAADPPQVCAVLRVFEQAGLGPPRLEDVPALISQQQPKPPVLTAPELKKIIDLLVRRGDLLRIKDLIFFRNAVSELSERLISMLKVQREISPTQFKDLVGQSRKYSIPLAEYFDAQRLTLRVGDQRRLRSPT